MGKTLVAIGLAVFLALFTAATVHAADCQFVLGFKTLRDLIGHDIVGECLEGEHYNAIGDSVQQTTGGLLAWRKADNWTAFTDGYRTWVNGPNGLQQRLNTERFEWEADYADFAPATARPALTRDALRNAVYTAGFPTYGTLQRARIGAQDPLAFGDLDGDGVDDAAVVLLLVDGNAAHWYLAAVLNENGAPKHVASGFLGLKIGIDSATIADGVVSLQTKQLGPNDPNCCPTKEVAVTFRLIDNAWQLIAETPPGSVTSNIRVHEPTPTPSSSRYDVKQVELLFGSPNVFALNAIGKLYSVDPRGIAARRIARFAQPLILAMPYIYLMQVWATGGPDSGHPLIDVEQFALAYFGDSRHYTRVAQNWLGNYIANPCGVSSEARAWVIQLQEAYPGTLEASIEAAVAPGSLTQAYVSAAYREAQQALLDNPNRYRCVRA